MNKKWQNLCPGGAYILGMKNLGLDRQNDFLKITTNNNSLCVNWDSMSYLDDLIDNSLFMSNN